jgi:predicted metal-binding membrane protein
VRREPLFREQLAVLAVLAALTAVAWIWTVTQQQAMAEMGRRMPSASPSMDGGSMGGQIGMSDLPMGQLDGPEPGVRLLLYLGMWVTMMAAMMLPAAAPMILIFGPVYRAKRARGDAFVPTWVFVAGYLAAWAGVGACAWALVETGDRFAGAYPMLGELGPRLAALAMLVAGAYQLTPLKQRCLAHCRSPLAFIMYHWQPGLGGAFRMGTEHGVYCVGCCWVQFLLLVVVGLSSLAWMGLITLIVCAEKLLPRVRAVTFSVAGLLCALGLLTLARPDLLALTTG